MQDGVNYTKGFLRSECFAGVYDWDGGEDTMTISIPDECDGYKVVSLGGFVGKGAPSAFDIHFPDSAFVETEDTIYTDEQIITLYHFTLNIGKNVKDIANVGAAFLSGHEETTVCVLPLFTVTCSEDNKWFYSKDGKLYDRSTDALVNAFYYYSDYEGYKESLLNSVAASPF